MVPIGDITSFMWKCANPLQGISDTFCAAIIASVCITLFASILTRGKHTIAKIRVLKSIPCLPTMVIAHVHKYHVHGKNKAIDRRNLEQCPYPQEGCTQISCSVRSWSHLIEYLYLVHKRCTVGLLDKVFRGCAEAGAVRLESGMRLSRKIGHSVEYL